MSFSVYSVKMVLLFPTNTKLPLCKKCKDAPKDDISGITEKDDTHPRKDDIGSLD